MTIKNIFSAVALSVAVAFSAGAVADKGGRGELILSDTKAIIAVPTITKLGIYDIKSLAGVFYQRSGNGAGIVALQRCKRFVETMEDKSGREFSCRKVDLHELHIQKAW